MSSRVYVDGRLIELQNCAHIVAMAQAHLNAAASAAGCGHAEVEITNVEASRARSTIAGTTQEDGIEIKSDAEVLRLMRAKNTIGIADSSGLKSALSRRGPDYDLEQANWSSLLDGKPIEVTDAPLEKAGVRIAADLECGALDGARLLILEKLDETGERSHIISLDEVLYDGNKEIKEERHRRALDAFMRALTAAPSPTNDDDGAAAALTGRLAASFKAAGLAPAHTKKTKGGDTQVVFSNRPAEVEKPQENTKTMVAAVPRK